MLKWLAKKQVKLTILIGAGVLVVALLAFVGWYSFATPAELGALNAAQNMVTVKYTDTSKAIILKPGITDGKGIVFYPGARIDPAAYAYKMGKLAESGITVVIVKPPLHLAPLDITSSTAYTALAPNVNEWYVAGHSLGGVKACSAAVKNKQFKGLILLGSYCASSIAASPIKVVSIGGSNDKLTTPADIDSHKSLLPASTLYMIIPGLNHAGFGDYGAQKGDGDMDISDTDAITQINRLISQFVGAGPYSAM